jgi:DNA-binding FrmR family transcriptional regulator
MDWWDKILNVLSLVLVVIQGLLAWALWSLRKQFVSAEHCDGKCTAMSEKHAALSRAQVQLEQAQKALPNADEVQAMAVQLAAIEGSIKTVEATVRGQSEVMQRIERPLNLLLEHHLRSEK